MYVEASALRRAKKAHVPSAWFSIKPGKPLVFWAGVYHVCRARRIKRSDRAGVRCVADELELKLSHNRDIRQVIEGMEKSR